jgi:hypothetical protein
LPPLESKSELDDQSVSEPENSEPAPANDDANTQEPGANEAQPEPSDTDEADGTAEDNGNATENDSESDSANNENSGEETKPEPAEDGQDKSNDKKHGNFFASHKKWVAICAVAIVAIIGAVYVTNYYIPETKYNKAEEAFNAHDFDTAEQYYNEIIDYKDSADKITLSEKGKSYFKGEDYFNSGDYNNAIAMFTEASGYEDSDERARVATQNKYYQEGKEAFDQGLYKVAGDSFVKADGLDDANDQAAASAQKLVDQQNYEDAITIYQKLGSGYSDQLANAKDLSAKADKLEDAQSKVSDGEFQEALDELNELPDDFTYGGVNVGSYKTRVSAAVAVLPACGTFTSTDDSWFKVRQTSKSSGSWNEWTGEGSCTLTVDPVLNDDGSITFKGTASFYRYTNFSTLSSLLKTKRASVSFEITSNGLPGSTNSGGANISYSNGTWKLTWSQTEANRSIYFTEYYSSSYTYTK